MFLSLRWPLAATTLVLAVQALQMDRSPSAIVANAAAAVRTAPDSKDASASAISVDPSTLTFAGGRPEKRARESSSADNHQATELVSADMSVDAVATPSGQDPLSVGSDSVDSLDGDINQLESDPNG